MEWGVHNVECKVWSVQCGVKTAELPLEILRSQRKARNSILHTWEPATEHFVRDFLQF